MWWCVSKFRGQNRHSSITSSAKIKDKNDKDKDKEKDY
jgi:hypothetical protein